MREREQLEQVISQYIRADYQQFLLQSIKPSIRLTPAELRGRRLISAANRVQKKEPGQSKFGGSPDLPSHLRWPISKEGVPYIFIAQIRLSDIATFSIVEQQPLSGILYFFFCPRAWDDGLVIHAQASKTLKAAQIPEEISRERKNLVRKLLYMKSHNRLVKESAIQFRLDYHIPYWSSLAVLRFQKEYQLASPWSIFHEDIYEKELLFDPEENSNTPNHHLWGWYNPIQTFNYELKAVSPKLREKDLSIEDIDRAMQWKLLFQTASDHQLNTSWGDWGQLYFFIHEDDLRQQDFSRVKAFLDCT